MSFSFGTVGVATRKSASPEAAATATTAAPPSIRPRRRLPAGAATPMEEADVGAADKKGALAAGAALRPEVVSRRSRFRSTRRSRAVW